MHKTVKIYTCRVQDHRKLKAENIEWLDTTVKTGTSVFKPTWDMVMKWKSGEMSDDEYTKQYRRLMEDSWRDNSSLWLRTLDTDRLVLGCFCPADTFCHRRLLAQMLARVATIYTDRVPVLCGELKF